MTSSTYQYEPLTAPARIRVLLLTGDSGPDVFANLVETTVPGGIPYEAISYAWGDSAKPHIIKLGGGETIPITASLYNALKSIRRRSAEDGVRAVWADAVCINQADTKEKSQQVPMMATIYRSATGVITYVGQAECGKDNAKRGLELAIRLVQLAESRRGLPVNPVLNTLSPERFGLPPFRDPAWDALREFISKPWSSRVWIVQESLLCANIRLLWGEDEISWDELRCLALKVLQPMCYPRMSGLCPASSEEFGGLFHMFHLRDEFWTPGRTIPILMLLQSCRDLESTDPRDRVFALASLNDKGDTCSMPMADYDKDTRQVFIDAAAGLLRGETGVMVLSYAGIRQQVDNLPTWVPDWTAPLAQIPVAQCRGFPVCGPFEMPAIERIDHPSGTLQLRGLVYDRIVHLTEKLHRGIVSARMCRSRWARDQIIRLLKLGFYPSGGSYLDALWRTLVCDLDAVQRDAVLQAYMSNLGASAGFPRPNPRLYVSAPSTLAHDFEAWVSPDAATARREARNWVAANSGKGRMAPPPIDPAIKAEWMWEQHIPDTECGERDRVNVFNSLRGDSTATTEGGDRESPGWIYRDTILRAGNLYRRLCTTDKGYIGVVPYEAEVGDVLLFLPGSTVPFVLREVKDGAYGQYWLVGDCYLHGLMCGEVFNEGGITWRSVTLV